jgi:hypothetical protein
MDKKQDVEVVIRWNGGAHWTNPAQGIFDDDPDAANILTLTGYYWDDINDNGYLDTYDSMNWYVSDPHQETSFMEMNIGTSPVAAGAWITGTYGSKGVWVTAAVAESPTPEPTTLIIWTGLCGIGLVFAWRKSMAS